MTFKNYCKLMLHVLICMLILLSVPFVAFIILYNNVPDWVTVIVSVVCCFPTGFLMMKYIFYVVTKQDFFS